MHFGHLDPLGWLRMMEMQLELWDHCKEWRATLGWHIPKQGHSARPQPALPLPRLRSSGIFALIRYQRHENSGVWKNMVQELWASISFPRTMGMHQLPNLFNYLATIRYLNLPCYMNYLFYVQYGSTNSVSFTCCSKSHGCASLQARRPKPCHRVTRLCKQRPAKNDKSELHHSRLLSHSSIMSKYTFVMLNTFSSTTYDGSMWRAFLKFICSLWTF